MRTELLPPGGYPIAVKYIKSFETQHVSGDTPPIIRSLKLYYQVVRRVVAGR